MWPRRLQDADRREPLCGARSSRAWRWGCRRWSRPCRGSGPRTCGPGPTCWPGTRRCGQPAPRHRTLELHERLNNARGAQRTAHSPLCDIRRPAPRQSRAPAQPSSHRHVRLVCGPRPSAAAPAELTARACRAAREGPSHTEPGDQAVHHLRAYATAAAACALARCVGPVPPTPACRVTAAPPHDRPADKRPPARPRQTAGDGPPPTYWSRCTSCTGVCPRACPRAPPPPPPEEPCEGAHAGSLPAAGRANTHTPRRARRRLRNDSRAHAVGTGARAAHSWHGAGTHVEGVKLSEHGGDRMFFFFLDFFQANLNVHFSNYRRTSGVVVNDPR